MWNKSAKDLTYILFVIGGLESLRPDVDAMPTSLDAKLDAEGVKWRSDFNATP